MDIHISTTVLNTGTPTDTSVHPSLMCQTTSILSGLVLPTAVTTVIHSTQTDSAQVHSAHRPRIHQCSRSTTTGVPSGQQCLTRARTCVTYSSHHGSAPMPRTTAMTLEVQNVASAQRQFRSEAQEWMFIQTLLSQPFGTKK